MGQHDTPAHQENNGTTILPTRSAGTPPSSSRLPFGTVEWQLTPRLDEEAFQALHLDSPLTAQLLHNRGIADADAARRFLAAEWRASGLPLLGLDDAARRIREAMAKGERIAVFGDFDCDGITSCALLTRTLRMLGADATPFVPTRDADGRGLNVEDVATLAEQGIQLIITTDCGTANVAEVEAARERDIEVIVTDHHPPHGEIARAYAVVNPQLEGDPTLNKALAGVGVAFRLAEALLRPEQAETLLDLVAIGTIADVVPITPENWALVHVGMQKLNRAPRPGLAALIHRAGLRHGQVSARDVSFALAPRLNASGRLGKPMMSVDLLLAHNATDAEAFAGQLDALNLERQQLMDRVVREARDEVLRSCRARHGETPGESAVLIAVGHHWHFGVLGLAAGRLADEYRRPVFVISQGPDECRGSARGPEGSDLGAVLARRPDFFRRFGGHARAAGFTLATEQLDEFTAFLREHFAAPTETSEVGADRTEGKPIPVDWELRSTAHIDRCFAEVEELEPFGPEFSEPVFVWKNAQLVGCWRSGPDGRNLRVVLREGGREVKAVWPKRGGHFDVIRELLPAKPRVQAIFTVTRAPSPRPGEPGWLMRVMTLDLVP